MKIFFTLLLTQFLLSSVAVGKISNQKPVSKASKPEISFDNKLKLKQPPEVITKKLLEMYQVSYKKKEDLLKLKKETLIYDGKSVGALIKVMKEGKYPEKNRWIATFLLGRIMGDQASPFIAKFVQHPSWVMRMASLKTLLALKDKRFAKTYAGALKDKSMIVRTQALENIRRLKLKELSPQVWGMLYDKRNYYHSKEGRKRTGIIKQVIQTIGDLKFVKAKDPLLKMIQKKKYKDIFKELDYSLSRITGKDSPQGASSVKKVFWSRYALQNKSIN